MLNCAAKGRHFVIIRLKHFGRKNVHQCNVLKCHLQLQQQLLDDKSLSKRDKTTYNKGAIDQKPFKLKETRNDVIEAHIFFYS